MKSDCCSHPKPNAAAASPGEGRVQQTRLARTRKGSGFALTFGITHRSHQRTAAARQPRLVGFAFQALSPRHQVSICLECNSSKLRGLKRKWIRCSAQATVLHLKKFIAKKLNLTSFNEVPSNRSRASTSHTHTQERRRSHLRGLWEADFRRLMS